MKFIELTLGKKAIVDDEDFEELNKHKWCAHPFYHKKTTYYYAERWDRLSKTKRRTIHRVLMNEPDGMIVDHIDGNTLNNQKSNLRVCTREQNGYNRKIYCNNLIGFKGVSFKKESNSFRSRIRFKKELIHLGYFKTPEEAARAYDEAAKKYHGEFAKLNNL